MATESGQSSRPFNKRAFIAVGMALTGATLPVTGIANHLNQMDTMSVTRHAWMAAHNSLATLFVLFAAWHVVLNRRAMLQHAKGLLRRTPGISREALLAAAIVAAATLLFVGHAYHLGGRSGGHHDAGQQRFL